MSDIIHRKEEGVYGPRACNVYTTTTMTLRLTVGIRYNSRNNFASVPDIGFGRYDGGRARLSRTETTRANATPRTND